MYLLSVVLVSVTLVARTLSQTPPGTSPATSETLSVYYGTTKVTPGIELPLASECFHKLLKQTIY